VESRRRGAARILDALNGVDDDIIPISKHDLILTLAQVDHVRAICREMLCICEESTALAEVAS
jgi:ABC-type Mn2+/Zn2+ transport system ATPase subunit